MKTSAGGPALGRPTPTSATPAPSAGRARQALGAESRTAADERALRLMHPLIFIELFEDLRDRFRNRQQPFSLKVSNRSICPRPWENASEVSVDALRFPGRRR